MDLREVFATNLRRWRNARELSQDDLAYEANVSRSYLSQLEKGSFYASLKVIGRLAEALEVELAVEPAGCRAAENAVAAAKERLAEDEGDVFKRCVAYAP